MIKFLFLDLDDTILDFHKAERIAIARTLQAHGAQPTEAVLARYHQINKLWWEALERQEVTRGEVQWGRFRDLFRELGLPVDPHSCARSYMENLSIGHYFLPGAEEAVVSLKKKYRLFLASNGNAAVQAGRLASSGLPRHFEGVFISEELGADKPAKAFFDACFARIPGFDPAQAMIVGDSLTSDIRGGNNAGLRTCWVNPAHAPRRADIRVDYEIEDITQLEALLETL